MAVPSGPRYLQDLVAVGCGRSPVFLACPPCRWPLTRLRAASCCRCLQVIPLRCRAHESVGVGIRCARVDPHVNPLSARPAADAARSQYFEETINKQEKNKNNEQRDVHPFVNFQRHAHRGPSACCASPVHCTVIRVSSHDLDEIRTRFTT